MRRLTWVSAAFVILTALSLGPLTPITNASQTYRYRSYGYRYRPGYRGYTYRHRPYYRPYYGAYWRPHYSFWPSFYWPYFSFSWGYPAPYVNVRYSYYAGGAVDYSFQHGSVRTNVEPKQAEIYVDGYYAGIADDFDGTFQRLYLPPGQHEIEMRLDGYRSHRQSLHVNSGTTYKLHHTMETLSPGETTPPPPEPPKEQQHIIEPEASEPYRQPPPPREDVYQEPEPTTQPRPEAERPPREYRPSQPEARFGMLALRCQPVDAQIFIDGELWGSLQGMERLVIHLAAGSHRIEIRKEGFQTFSTDVDILQGETSQLNVKLDGIRL